MTTVECRRKSGPYCRHVSGGALASTPLTGKKSAVGLRTTWYSQFTADHTARTATAPTRIRIASGAATSAMRARRPDRMTRQTDACRAGRPRLRRDAVLTAREWAMTRIHRVCIEVPQVWAATIIGPHSRRPDHEETRLSESRGRRGRRCEPGRPDISQGRVGAGPDQDRD